MDLYAGGTAAGTWPTEATFRMDSHAGGISLGVMRNTKILGNTRYQKVRDTDKYEIPGSAAYREVPYTEVQDTWKYDVPRSTLRDARKYDQPRSTRCQGVA